MALFARSARSNHGSLHQAITRLDSRISELASQHNANHLELLAIKETLLALCSSVKELNDVRRMLDAKSLVAFQARKQGRVAGGVRRAATALRDDHGRYV
jgi:hypothetical protein